MDAVEIARKYGVMGSPIMKLFKNGEVYREYLGDKNKAEMVKFIAKRTGPAPVPTKLHSVSVRQELKLLLKFSKNRNENETGEIRIHGISKGRSHTMVKLHRWRKQVTSAMQHYCVTLCFAAR